MAPRPSSIRGSSRRTSAADARGSSHIGSTPHGIGSPGGAERSDRALRASPHRSGSPPRRGRSDDSVTELAGVGRSIKPSDGLEPSTPSLPCAAGALPLVAGGCRSACLRRSWGFPVCDWLPPVAPAWLHRCSIPRRRIAGRKTVPTARRIAPLQREPFSVGRRFWESREVPAR